MENSLELIEQILKAIDDREFHMVEHFLDQALSVDCANNSGKTYLHIAIEKHCTLIANLLVQRGANLNLQDHRKRTPLHLACHESLQIFNLLVDLGADVNLQDDQGETPLHIASNVNFNIKNRAVTLLKNGAISTIRNQSYQTPLHHAAFHSFGLAKILLEMNENLINLRDKAELTPLHMACSYRPNLKLVSLLLEKGANVNAQDFMGNTPLHYASCLRSVKLIRILLIKGATINTKCHRGETALHRSCMYGYKDQVVDYLIGKGAEINAQNHYGQTPLHHAVTSKVGIVNVLLKRGAKVDIKSKYYDTPYNEISGEDISEIFGSQFDRLVRIGQCKDAIVKHIIKMKTAKLKVNVDIDKELNRLEYKKMKQKSISEFEKIKYFTTNDVFPLRIFKKDNKPHSLTIENVQKYDEFLYSPDFLKTFPVYGYLMRNIFNRSKLMTRAADSFYSDKRKDWFMELPTLVTEKILTYLSLEDVKNLIMSEE